MKKILLVCILLLVMALSLSACKSENNSGNSNEEIKYSEGLEFTSNGDGTCSVTGLGSFVGNAVTVPEKSPKGDTVTAIGDSAFLGCSTLGTVSLPESLENIGIGAFDTHEEAEAALKYVKCKFCRLALGLLKVTQSNSPDKWKYVPLQDFTDKSDINWSQSISDIDKQLYAKYKLSEKEISFIEEKVRSMEDAIESDMIDIIAEDADE